MTKFESRRASGPPSPMEPAFGGALFLHPGHGCDDTHSWVAGGGISRRPPFGQDTIVTHVVDAGRGAS